MVTLYPIHLLHNKNSPAQPPDELILTQKSVETLEAIKIIKVSITKT